MQTSAKDVASCNQDGDDDHAARMLAKDARDYSLRYSSLGTYGGITKRSAGGAPKPNTRFLKHILRDTDTHNQNLKRKEEEEARQRLRELRRGNTSSGITKSSRSHDERETAAKMRRAGSRRDEERGSGTKISHRSRDHRSEKDERSSRHRREKHRGRREEDEPEADDRRRHKRRRERDDNDAERHRKHRRLSVSDEISPDRERTRLRDRHRKHGSSHEGRHRGDKHGVSSEREREQYSSPKRASSHPHDGSADAQSVASSDSDPLSSLIGPPLPSKTDLHTSSVLPRGRGAHSSKSNNMDLHFVEGYDPALDVHLDDDDLPPQKSSRRPVPGMEMEDDDWDMALEALRDRAAWKRKGAERLREAGFEDTVVRKWENKKAFSGLDDGCLTAVKWSAKGEGREWDRGKVMDADGHIDIKPSW